MSSTVDVDVKGILDPLETIERRGFGRYDVFRDWGNLLLSALQRDDDAYLDTLDRYDCDSDRDRGDRIPDLFATAFAELMAMMDETGQDVLGVAYEEFGMQTDAFGQHFTPHNVAATMAEIQTATDENGIQEDPVTIADPACGSGRMLVLAAVNRTPRPSVSDEIRISCVRRWPRSTSVFSISTARSSVAIHSR